MSANGITTAFWGMTINNYDANDVVLVENGFPDYMRELVWQFEEGEEGTPHIQAWIKLQRQQRMSFVKKLFPRGHFTALTADEYNANMKKYSQKTDATKRSPAVHRFNDPLDTIESLVKKVCHRMYDYFLDEEEADFDDTRKWMERDMVREDYKLAKIFVSQTYKAMWKNHGHDMYACVFQQIENEKSRVCKSETHTHTHTHAEKVFASNLVNGSESTSESVLWEGETQEEDDHSYEESSCSSTSSSSDQTDC